jgi:uncharacterized protein YwqG
VRNVVLTALALLCLAVPAAAAAAAAQRPTVEQTLATARHLGVGPQAEQLKDHFLPAARFVASSGDARLGATRIGGGPDLPAGTRWPRCNGHPLTFVLQVALADLRAAVPGTTRGTGMLSLFLGTRYAPDSAPEAASVFAERGLARVGAAKCIAVLHTSAGAALRHAAPVKGSSPFPSRPQRLRPTLTVPGWEIAESRFGARFSDDTGGPWITLQQRAASGVLDRVTPDSLHQLLGWSVPIQEDPAVYRCAGQPGRLLLQFTSDGPFDLDQGAAGILMVVIGVQDLRAGRFDRLCAEHQLD